MGINYGMLDCFYPRFPLPFQIWTNPTAWHTYALSWTHVLLLKLSQAWTLLSVEMMDTEKPPKKQRRDSSSGLAEDWSMHCATAYDQSWLHKRSHTIDGQYIDRL